MSHTTIVLAALFLPWILILLLLLSINEYRINNQLLLMTVIIPVQRQLSGVLHDTLSNAYF